MSVASRIMTYPQYARIRHTAEYIVDLRAHDFHLLLFGSHHSSDPTLPMFDQIDEAFARLEPAFALHEGTPPFAEPEREIAIRRHGEAGLLRHLAARAGIATASMDIPLAHEARLLRRKLSREDALVYLVVRQLASYNRKTLRMDFDIYFRDFFARIGPPLDLPTIDWPLIERSHLRLLGYLLSASTVTGRETDPLQSQLPTQRIARFSNHMRDRYMLRRLLEALAKHRIVFATVGVSHAVMLEPALREAFDLF